ncbi:MAG: DNA mismatch repair endonuclease MutL [Anaerolineales bacterium]|nr:DNA mismatch repair endonuclease MutL [Anaerolineales bacterium]
MPIEILPEQVASAIAAGEVVERPSSVVKELVENALDANASRIEVVIEEGGRQLIQVSDDGEGIHAEEIGLSVARFATSKLRTADDLHHIETLGFRGEALSSIGAISFLEISSKAPDQPAGAVLRVEGGKAQKPKPAGVPIGTQVRVRNLFFNVPARKEFLKTDPTERRWITTLITRYALAYPGVSFKLSQEGRVVFRSSGNGDRREILAEIYGLEIAREMLGLPGGGTSELQVQGYLSPPHIHRSNRRELTFFVNGRWVQDSSLSAAVLQAYHTMLMVGRYPIVTLFLEIEPAEIDVNVHPAKAEIRFRDSGKVFTVVQRAVRSALIGQSPAPPVDLPSRWTGQAHEIEGQQSPDWSFWHEAPSRPIELEAPERSQGNGDDRVPLLRPVGQVGASYLVAEGPDGLYLIDQHAAHERILFDAFMEANRSGSLEAQQLLDPVAVEFSPGEAETIEAHLDVLNDLGFHVEQFGPRTYRLHAMPSMLMSRDPGVLLRSVVEEFEEDETPLASEIEARIAARICKRVAVKAGQVLTRAEQERLLRDLEACLAPRTCPHGRPTMIHLSVASLERQFGRR